MTEKKPLDLELDDLDARSRDIDDAAAEDISGGFMKSMKGLKSLGKKVKGKVKKKDKTKTKTKTKNKKKNKESDKSDGGKTPKSGQKSKLGMKKMLG